MSGLSRALQSKCVRLTKCGKNFVMGGCDKLYSFNSPHLHYLPYWRAGS